jgi:hypothetical protein
LLHIVKPADEHARTRRSVGRQRARRRKREGKTRVRRRAMATTTPTRRRRRKRATNQIPAAATRQVAAVAT